MSDDNKTFHEHLEGLIDTYIHNVYDSSQQFPKEEVYDARSQLRRSAMSVMLNYKEGYARQSKKELKRFLKISFGSLKESEYLVDFANKRSWIDNENAKNLQKLSEEIAKMLWSTIQKIDSGSG
jgi:four helix bundle protein